MARTTYTCGSRSVSEDKITEQIFTQEKPPSLFIKIHVCIKHWGLWALLGPRACW